MAPWYPPFWLVESPIFFPWATGAVAQGDWATALSGHHALLSDHMCSSLLEVLPWIGRRIGKLTGNHGSSPRLSNHGSSLFGNLENSLKTLVLPSDCRKVPSMLFPFNQVCTLRLDTHQIIWRVLDKRNHPLDPFLIPSGND